MALPEPVAENRDAVATGGIFLGEERAAVRRRRADDVEKAGADRAREDRFGAGAAACERELAEAIERHSVEEPGFALPVVEVRRRHRKALQSRERGLRRSVK